MEANLIDAPDGGGIAIDDSVRRDVLDNLGEASDDGVGADTAELVDGGESRDDGVVIDMNVTGEGSVVREDDVVADLTIVRDVGVG